MPLFFLLLFLTACQIEGQPVETIGEIKTTSRDEEKANHCPSSYLKTLSACVNFKWVLEPRVDSSGVFEIALKDSDSEAPIVFESSIYSFRVLTSMPGHPHAALIPLYATDLGVLRSDPISMNMPGLWDLRIQLIKERQVVEQVKFQHTL